MRKLETKQKKLLAIIVGIIAFILIMFIGPCNGLWGKEYLSIVKPLPKYDMYDINENSVLQQDFTPRFAHIKDIQLVVILSGEGYDGMLDVKIYNNKNKLVLNQQRPLSGIMPGEWTGINVPCHLTPGNTYRMEISSVGASVSPKLLLINNFFGVNENGQSYLNGETIDGSWVIGFQYNASFSKLYRLIVCMLVFAIAFISILFILYDNAMDRIKQFLFENGDLKKNVYYFSMAIIVLTAVFIHLYKLSGIPIGVNIDEMGMGYDAYCLANYGVDRYEMSWPVYFLNWGTGQNALYTWITAWLIKIFGYSVLILRVLGAFNSFVTMYFGAKIVKKKFKTRYSVVIFSILFCIIPIYLIMSRYGLESYLMLGTSTMFLYLLMQAVEKDTMLSYAICGVSAGIILYTYGVSYVVLICFLLYTFIYLLRLKKLKFKNVIALGIPLGIIATPIILEQLVNIFGWGDMKLGVFTIPTMIYRYRGSDINFRHVPEDLWLTIKDIFLFDGEHRSSYPQFQTMYWISIPAALVGIAYETFLMIRSFAKKEWNISTLIIIWFWCMFGIGCIMGGKHPSCYRLNAVYFAATYLLISGLLCIYRSCIKKHDFRIGMQSDDRTSLYQFGFNPKVLRVFLVVLCIGYTLYFAHFVEYYFYRAPYDYYPEDLCLSTFEDSLEVLKAQGEEIESRTTYVPDIKAIYTCGSLLPNPYDYKYSGLKEEYLNYKFFKENPEEIDDGANYIIQDYSYTRGLAYELENKGYTVEKAGRHFVCFKR